MIRQKSISDPQQILQDDEDDNYSTRMLKGEEEKENDSTFLTGAQVDQHKKKGKLDLSDPENLESLENSTLLVEQNIALNNAAYENLRGVIKSKEQSKHLRTKSQGMV